MIISDGEGRGHQAGVDNENRLQVLSAQRTLAQAASQDNSDCYFFTTDSIALTAGVSAVMRIRNDDARDFVIAAIQVSSSASVVIRVLRNVSAGTIVTGGTVTTAPNANFGSSKPFNGEFRLGADGVTATDGELVSILVDQIGVVPGGADSGGVGVLPTNTNVTLTATASGAANVGITVVGYYSERSN